MSRWRGTIVVAAAASALGATGAVAAPTSPSTMHASRAGAYSYATSGAFGYGDISSEPAVTTMSVDPATHGRQHSRWDLRDAHGNGDVLDRTIEFRADGVHLVSESDTYTDQTGTSSWTCAATRPPLMLAARPTPGQQLRFNMACTGFTQTFVITVLAPQTVEIAGQTRKLVVVREQDSWGDTSGSGSGTSQVWLMPHTDQPYRVESTYGEQMYGVAYYKSHYTAQLSIH